MKLLYSMALCAILLGVIASCSDSSGPGPVDGTYENITLTCNGTPTSMGGTASLTITNTTGTFKLVNGACTLTQAQTLTYPSGNTLTLQSGAASCDPAGCAGGDCNSTGGDPADTFTYTLTGNTLSISRTAGPDDDCNEGETQVFTGTKS